MRNILVIALCAIAGLTAQAEVISLTLGIDVNSPYGISEPWVTIREGLLRLDYVESVANLPDRKSGTGEMRTKNGRVPDVDTLAKALRELGAGATLRGVEVTINAHIIKEGDHFLLKVSKTGETLRLAPLTKRIQRNALEITESERNAFARLVSHSEGGEVRITGPLRAHPDAGALQTLEVRIFELPGRSQNQTNHN